MILERPSPVDVVLDTSAVMAVLRGEEFAANVEAHLRTFRGAVVSAATVVELSIVAASRVGAAGRKLALTILDAAHVVSVPVDPLITELAWDGWQRYGKGRHPAALNYGDCFSYATAMHYTAPLLCIGEDFVKTDVAIIDVTTAPA